MAKSQRIRRFPVISERVENWKLQKYNGILQKSPDFKEITLAITLLAGLLALLWKCIEYFNNNAVDLNNTILGIVYIAIGFLLFEFLLIF